MAFIKQDKTNWKYILIVLILAVIVGGGILAWIKQQEVPPAEFLEIKKPEKVVEDETANWKIYRNEEYGFEIKYPDIFTTIEGHLGFVVVFQPKEKYACNPIIKVFEGTVEEYEKSLESDPLTEIISKKDIVINNYNGREIRSATYEMGLADVCVLLPYNSEIYKICACEESDMEDIFNQMLSTFRFLK